MTQAYPTLDDPTSDLEAIPPSVRQQRREQIVAVARELLERDGPDGLSMRRLAAQLGLRAPSLYKHVKDKAELENAIVSQGLFELGELMAEVSEREPGAQAMARAYRTWALEHPHVYRLIMYRPLAREHLEPGAHAAAGAPLRKLVGDDMDAARALWAATHGLIMLEMEERVPPSWDLDALWTRVVEAMQPR